MEVYKAARWAQGVLLLGLAVQITGLLWDLKYHETLVGVDPFLVAPHIVGIVGLLMVVAATLWGTYLHFIQPRRRTAAVA